MHCALCKSLKTLNNTVFVYTNLEDVNDTLTLPGISNKHAFVPPIQNLKNNSKKAYLLLPGLLQHSKNGFSTVCYQLIKF